MEAFIFMVLLLTGISGLIGLLIWRNNRKRYRFFLQKIRKMWANIPEREYTSEELISIASYAMRRIKRESGFAVDDITWNDLDMEQLFLRMNGTVCSCGESYLYYMLRKPSFSEDELKERDRLIEFFRSHDSERIAIQSQLRYIQKLRNYSVADFVYALDGIKRESTMKYYGIALGILVSVISMFFSAPTGIMLLFLMIGINISIHFRIKGRISAYIYSFSTVLQIIRAGEKMGKLKIPELQMYLHQLGESSKNLRGLKKKTVALNSMSEGSGDFLSIVFAYLNILIPIDLIQFYSSLKFLDGHQKDVEELMENLGILDSAIAIASYREYLTLWTKPELKAGALVSLSMDRVYHPLIQEPVANSITVEKGVLLTGSNASGKSTFLKTVAINVLLAQTIYTCTCRRYSGNYMKVMTSMALRDNLQGGESYFIVEIKSLQRILQESQKDQPLLCLVDEVLRGTNTIERIAASSQILKSLARPHILPFAATHDIELAYMLQEFYDNYHFEEEIKDGDIHFNYLLQEGVATSRNAISLLGIIGYDQKIVSEARKVAMHFETNGVWDVLSCNE